MPRLIQLPEDLHRFVDLDLVYDEDGYIIWRRGTGGNVEITHVKSVISGGGGRLLTGMLRKLLDDPPYASVFGFTRMGNEKAREFYLKAGFTLSTVRGVYADGEAVVFSAPYSYLCEVHLTHATD